MQKIPTIFERDWDGDRSRVTREPAAGCEWVFAGEGVATRKYDGTSCLVEDGQLFKRLAIDEHQAPPEGFREVEREQNERTGKTKVIGWLPVGEGPEDRWHREAFIALCIATEHFLPENGTYELLGPKIQGNPEQLATHTLIRHDDAERYIVSRQFDAIAELLRELNVEGFVFHHPDGRMAKIKARDFGIKRELRTLIART